MTQSPNERRVRRRALLGAVAGGGAASLGGCLRRVRSITGWSSGQRVSLRIKTLPADSDPYALRAARAISAWYRTAGIDAQVAPIAEEELLRQVLLRNDYDVFVGRMASPQRDPDSLYGRLHSKYADVRGWQNPFGFADFDVDDLLEAQRRTTGRRRQEVVADLLRSVAESQPFTVLGFPDEIRAARTTAFTNWSGVGLRSARRYLSVDRVDATVTDGAGTDEGSILRVATTDRRATENLNPLSVEYRRSGVLTGLLYDSIGVRTPAGTEPQLAESWAFVPGSDGPRATVTLRAGLRWHDGEPVTAEDVAFTYALLADTTLGAATVGDGESDTSGDARLPAPRFQGRVSLVDDVRATAEDTVEVQFVDCAPGVAVRAFTVPILPKHVWADRTDRASVSGIEIGRVTEALVANNIPPVGSGPLRFVRNTPRESLVLESFAGGPDREDWPLGAPAFDRLAVQVVGSDDAAVGVVAAGDADVTGTPVGASTVPRIGRADDVELVVHRSAAPYIVGYNTRNPPLTNPRFRHALARLIDQAYLANDAFDGYLSPATTPLGGTAWEPDELEWREGRGDPVTPFIGDHGELAVGRTRRTFRDAGFQYDDGRLLRSA